MTILDRLADHARRRTEQAKRKTPLAALERQALSMPKGGFAFEAALKKPGLSFICECKRASPSKGLIAPAYPYLQIAGEYEAAGADAVSVLTEPKWFLGSDEHLKEIAGAVSVPCLRKDFTVDAYMIYETRLLGASAVLLICAILTDAELEETPLAQPHLCDRCGKCAQACPGRAIDPSSGKVDHWQCAAYYVGANMTKNPFMPPDAYLHEPDRLAIIAGEAKLSPERARKIIDETFFYPPIKHAYLSSICGRACDVACYIHLEEKGVLKRSFKTPFRKRPEWKLSIQIETEEEKNAHA